MTQDRDSSNTMNVKDIKPETNSRDFADDIFEFISLNGIYYILMQIALKGPFKNKPLLERALQNEYQTSVKLYTGIIVWNT